VGTYFILVGLPNQNSDMRFSFYTQKNAHMIQVLARMIEVARLEQNITDHKNYIISGVRPKTTL
jgi:hypothetical protein